MSWLPDVDLGPFRFHHVEESFPGGLAHDPETGRIAVFLPGDPIPEGWEPGRPKLTVEEWTRRWRGYHHRQGGA